MPSCSWLASILSGSCYKPKSLSQHRIQLHRHSTDVLILHFIALSVIIIIINLFHFQMLYAFQDFTPSFKSDMILNTFHADSWVHTPYTRYEFHFLPWASSHAPPPPPPPPKLESGQYPQPPQPPQTLPPPIVIFGCQMAPPPPYPILAPSPFQKCWGCPCLCKSISIS